MALALPAAAQRAAIQPDSAQAQIRTVLRGFYSNLESRNWDALAAYVLSPKLRFRLLYFEDRWRFIYTDLLEAPTNVSTGR